MTAMRIARPHAGRGRRHAAGPARARGQSLVEYLIILPSLLLLVMGAIQFGLLYQIKSQVNYATFLAARQGALKNGSTTAIKDAFAAGMTPLFTPTPDVGGMLRGRAVGMIEAFNPLATQIERVNPPDSVKDDFKIDDPNDANSWIIPNDNLQYRSTAVGSNSQLNIQDANILKIRVTYCAKLIVPLANVAIYSLVNGIETAKAVGGRFFSTPTGVATSTNSCTDFKDKYASQIQTLNEIGSYVGADFSFIQSALNSVSSVLSSNIPIINWVVGGYRIPVTAEAVVRMQTPMKFKK